MMASSCLRLTIATGNQSRRKSITRDLIEIIGSVIFCIVRRVSARSTLI
jgi:hypothetical protein